MSFFWCFVGFLLGAFSLSALLAYIGTRDEKRFIEPPVPRRSSSEITRLDEINWTVDKTACCRERKWEDTALGPTDLSSGTARGFVRWVENKKKEEEE